MPRPLPILLAVLALAGAAQAQTTRPADSLVYRRADGRDVVLAPATGAAPVNRDVLGATLLRPGGGVGEWVVPAPVPVDPNVVNVAPGQSWVAAAKLLTAGQTLVLPAGVVTETLTDPSVRLAGVTLAAHPSGTTIRATGPTALWAWCWDDVTVRGVRFEGPVATDAGVRLNGCVRVTLDGCTVTGFAKGVTTEAASAGGNVRRGTNVRLVRCDVSGNCGPATIPDKAGKPQRLVSAGLYASNNDGLVLADSRFADNGWSATNPGSEFNHDVYLAGDNGPPTVTGCTFVRPSSHGLQARPGGVIEDNTFIDCPIGLSYGLVNGDGPVTKGGVSGRVRRNLFIGTRQVWTTQVPPGVAPGYTPRGWAMEVGDNVLSADVTGNAVLIPTPAAPPAKGQAVAAFKVDVGVLSASNPFVGTAIGVRDLSFADNTVTHFSGVPVWVHPTLTAKLRTRSAATRLTVQAAWPAADGTVEAAARTRAK